MSLASFFSKMANAVVAVGEEIAVKTYETLKPAVDYFSGTREVVKSHTIVANNSDSSATAHHPFIHRKSTSTPSQVEGGGHLKKSSATTTHKPTNVQTAYVAKEANFCAVQRATLVSICPISAEPTPISALASTTYPVSNATLASMPAGSRIGAKINADYGTKVNFDQLAIWEGGQHLKGYVPWAPGKNPTFITDEHGNQVIGGTSQSGVTVATGVDIGQLRTEAGIRYFLSGDPPTMDSARESLITKLLPYGPLKRQAAVDYKTQHPLSITQDEADILDNAAQRAKLTRAISDYGNAIQQVNTHLSAGQQPSPAFLDLTAAQQTVLLSRAYQQGSLVGNVYLQDAAAGNWNAVADDLDAMAVGPYKSEYQGRTNLEAKYLRANM